MSIRLLKERFPKVFKYEAGEFHTAGSYGGVDDEDYIIDILGLGEEYYDKEYLGKHKFTRKDEAKLIRYFKKHYENLTNLSWKEAKEQVEEEICLMVCREEIDYWSPDRLKQYQERCGY